MRRRVVVRFAAPPDDFAAPPVDRFAVERFAAGLRAADARLAPPDDFARDAVDFLAVDLPAVDFRAVVFRPAGLRAPLLRDADDDELEPLLALALPSIDHLPLMTRCAASATASAISDPSLVALDATLLAACCAVSAASSPASRIALRALGLAAIAAAAAVRPAASISLLIAAFASLSTGDALLVALDPDEREREEPEEDLEEVLRADFAIA